MSCEVKSCVFVGNKSIIKMFLTSNCCFVHIQVHNITFSADKVISSESGAKYTQYRTQHCFQVKTVQYISRQICHQILM